MTTNITNIHVRVYQKRRRARIFELRSFRSNNRINFHVNIDVKIMAQWWAYRPKSLERCCTYWSRYSVHVRFHHVHNIRSSTIYTFVICRRQNVIRVSYLKLGVPKIWSRMSFHTETSTPVGYHSSMYFIFAYRFSRIPHNDIWLVNLIEYTVVWADETICVIFF